MIGDDMHAIFEDALDALAATVALQQVLADDTATNGISLGVRCGLHMGVVERRDNDYFGVPVNRAARIMSAAHGGQVLSSRPCSRACGIAFPRRCRCAIRSGSAQGPGDPEHVHQVVDPDLRQAFREDVRWNPHRTTCRSRSRSFIGCEQALAEVRRLLTKTRLRTLTGSAGVERPD